MDSSTAEEWPVYGYIVRGTCCTTYLPEQTYSPKDRHTDHDIALPTETPLPALYTCISSIIEADDVRVDTAPATVQHNTATPTCKATFPKSKLRDIGKCKIHRRQTKSESVLSPYSVLAKNGLKYLCSWCAQSTLYGLVKKERGPLLDLSR